MYNETERTDFFSLYGGLNRAMSLLWLYRNQPIDLDCN